MEAVGIIPETNEMGIQEISVVSAVVHPSPRRQHKVRKHVRSWKCCLTDLISSFSGQE
jgi:hypothetical protein